jgi:uncharacterized protein (TIGR03083 family)
MTIDDEWRQPDSEVFGLLAEGAGVPPPATLAARVVDAAISLRPSGRPIESLGGGHVADPAEAFVRTIGEMRELLTDADSGVIVEPYGWTVTQLVAHLLTVDLYFGRQLGLWQHDIDETREHDHLGLTEAAVLAASMADFTETLTSWHEVSSAVCAHVAALDDDGLRRQIKFHVLDTRLSTVLVVRVFEVWTHIEDLCRALHRTPPGLDASRLHMMSRTGVRAIPLGLLLSNLDGGQHTVRLVLTGPGGGVWNKSLQLGGEPGEPSVTIVADALEFCRLAAQRIAPSDLDAEVEGPMDLALTVLRGASVFGA